MIDSLLVILATLGCGLLLALMLSPRPSGRINAEINADGKPLGSDGGYGFIPDVEESNE